MKRERGQAMVEFAIATATLVAIAWGSVQLARYQGIQRQALVAARHAVFSSAWNAGRATPPDGGAVHALFLANDGWRDRRGALLLDAGDVTVTSTQATAPGAAGRVEHLLGPLRRAGGFLGSGFDLGGPGYHRADVRVNYASAPDVPPFDGRVLDFRAHATVLANTWSAAGPAQVGARAGGLVPTAILARPLAALAPFAAPLALLEPDLRRFCPGLIEPDRVPEDRLGPVLAAAAPGQCR